MLAELPLQIQMTVINFLSANDFPQAKQIHDDWVAANTANGIFNRPSEHACQASELYTHNALPC